MSTQPLTYAPVLALSLFLSYRLIRALVCRFTTDVHRVPTPPGGSWLWGHELEPFSKPCGEVYANWFATFGPVVRMRGSFGHGDILAIADPGIISHIFTKHPYIYPKSLVFRPFIERTVGKGLVWVEGEEHRKMRPLLNSAFTAEKTRGAYECIKVCTDNMIMMFADHVSACGGDTIVQIRDWTNRATRVLDVIGRVAFGHDFGCGETAEAKKITNAMTQMVGLGMTHIGKMAPIILRNFPALASLPLPSIQSQSEIKVTVRQLGEKLLAKAANDPESVKGNDLLSTLIRANINDGGFSKDELLDHICTFVVGGYETSSATLSFTLLALAQNPDVQDRLRREILEFGVEPTYDDLFTKLPYLDAVAKEGLRMFPVSAYTERVALVDDVLPLRKPLVTSTGETLTSLRIKKGQLIAIPSIAINRNNAVWGDGWAFRPERWLTPDQLPDPSESTQGWSQMLTFLEGPRMCIGYRLAILELKIMLSSLVRAFIFRETGAEIEFVFSTNLQARITGKDEASLPLRVSLAEP
ncbi:hypothetical protein BOTBODRAFT_191732 [Botryobasidium botryosum FD-172 SS1]|uniref:Cytochrome P450 n=1 Tax=Botryobasidium botryosum (strain FD-172 SS1) TaxID=930990 RepID=A0A067LYY1_BOTB1|nr:hypothetical protein BOTBODRAFT_191732 [Botryobasidium botryosum FD-172 SS1]